MGSRPIRQRMRDINLRALAAVSCMALLLGIGSSSHTQAPALASVVGQGTVSPAFAAPLGLDSRPHVRGDLWEVSGAVSVQDDPRWVF